MVVRKTMAKFETKFDVKNIKNKNIHTVQLEKASSQMDQGQGNMDKIPMPRFTLTVSTLMEVTQTKVIEKSDDCSITIVCSLSMYSLLG